MEVKLSKWQTEVLDDTHRFKVINVGRRSGKTVLSIIKMIELCRPGAIIWYVSPTYKQSKNIAWALLKQYMPSVARANFNESELKCSVTAFEGCEIQLKGADNPDSLRGVKIDFIIFDECAFFTDWRRTWEALRPVLVDSRADCWFVSTPNGFNHFYDLWVKKEVDSDYQSFHYTTYDNPYIDPVELEKVKIEMDERSFGQEFLADFSRPAGTVYKEWSLDNYKPIEYDANLPLHITFDWGINDPTSIIWLQPSGGEVRVIDYYEASDANIEHFVSVLGSKPYKPADLYTGDPAGRARTLTTGTSVIELLAKKGIHVRMRDGVRIPDQIRVAHGFMPRLFVNSDKCDRFRDCLLNYSYPEKKESAVNQENEVPIHNEFSHAMRAFEYWAVNVGDILPKAKRTLLGYVGGDGVTGYGRRPVYSGPDSKPDRNLVFRGDMDI